MNSKLSKPSPWRAAGLAGVLAMGLGMWMTAVPDALAAPGPATAASPASASAPAQASKTGKPAEQPRKAADKPGTKAPDKAGKPADKAAPKAPPKAAAKSEAKADVKAPAKPVAKPVEKAPANSMANPQAFCEELTQRLPNVSKAICARAQVAQNPGRSVKGRPLFQRDVIAENAHLRVLVIGGIHGDELSSTALVLHWIGAAMETPSNIHWRFVPLMNPDGMLLNRPTRMNANGVDLNRNFPTPNWDKEAPLYWNKRTKNDPRRYPGPKPLSEPESKWLHDEMARWKPNLIVSVHAPYGVLDFDGPVVAPQRLGRLYLDQVGIFPGSLGNYGGVHKKVPVVTIELPSAFRTPQEAEIRQMWLDLLRWTAERLGAG